MPVAPIQINDIPVLEAGPMPPSFHLMTKPSGAICNLDCKYCYFPLQGETLPRQQLPHERDPARGVHAPIH